MKLEDFLIEHRGLAGQIDITTQDPKKKLIYFFKVLIKELNKLMALKKENLDDEDILNLQLATAFLIKFFHWSEKKVAGGTYGIEAEDLFVSVINVFDRNAKAYSLKSAKKSDLQNIVMDIKGNIKSLSGLSIKFYGESTKNIFLGKMTEYRKDVLEIFRDVVYNLVPSEKVKEMWRTGTIEKQYEVGKDKKYEYKITLPRYYYYENGEPKRIFNPLGNIISKLKEGSLGKRDLKRISLILTDLKDNQARTTIKERLKTIMGRYTRTKYSENKFYDTDFLISKVVPEGDFVIALIPKEKMVDLLAKKVMHGILSFDKNTNDVVVSFNELLNSVSDDYKISINPLKWLEILKKFKLQDTVKNKEGEDVSVGIYSSTEELDKSLDEAGIILVTINGCARKMLDNSPEVKKEGMVEMKRSLDSLVSIVSSIKNTIIYTFNNVGLAKKSESALNYLEDRLKEVFKESVNEKFFSEFEKILISFANGIKSIFNKILDFVGLKPKTNQERIFKIEKMIDILNNLSLNLKEEVMEDFDNELNEKRGYKKKNMKYWQEKLAHKKRKEQEEMTKRIMKRSASPDRVDRLLNGLNPNRKRIKKTPAQVRAREKKMHKLAQKLWGGR